MITAFHTLRLKNKGLEPFEIYTLILSALEWKKHNGPICLVTDEKSLNEIKRLGLSKIYDEVLCVLDEFDNFNINEEVFWAGCKIFALYKMLENHSLPLMMLDLDFIVWENLGKELETFTGVGVIHREEVNNEVYPNYDFFKLKEGFVFPDNLDWTVPACNTALAYFGAGTQHLVQEYISTAFHLMQGAAVNEPILSYMVFVEQRLLAMLCIKNNVEIKPFSLLEDLFTSNNLCYTHIWGEKRRLREDGEYAKKFSERCLSRIRKDFPSINI